MAREDPYRFPLPQGPANMEGERATISLITMRSHLNEVRTMTITKFPTALNNDITIRRASKRGHRGYYRTPAADNSCYESQVVSREHAFISIEPDTKKVVLRDNHSTHGTWLNGRQLTPGGSEILPDHCYIRCGVDVVRGVETFTALVLEVIINWADDPEYQYGPSAWSSFSYANAKIRSYFPIPASHFDQAHKWGPHTVYGEHLPATPPLPSSNTFCVPEDSDVEELPEETYVEDLEALNDSDVEEVTMEQFSPRSKDVDVEKATEVIDSSPPAAKPAEPCDVEIINNPYPSPTYPVIRPSVNNVDIVTPKNDEPSALAVEVPSTSTFLQAIMDESEGDSDVDSEDDMEHDDMEYESDDSEYPDVWHTRRIYDDEKLDDEEMNEESYNEDDSDESGEISDGSENSDDGSELELEATEPESESAIEPEVTEKCIDPGLLVQSIASSSKTPASIPPSHIATVSSSNILDSVKTEESRELNTRIRLPTLEGNASVFPVNPCLDSSAPPRYPNGLCNLSAYFAMGDHIDNPIQHRNTHGTYTDGPFQSPVATKAPSIIDGLNQLPSASLKRKASKIEVNDHEDKIVISASDSPVDTKHSAAVDAITSALSESELESKGPLPKRVKTSHSPSHIASHATTAAVAAVLSALGTIALLASLPTEYFQ